MLNVLLISIYELGRQPFGLASPAAWLRAEGHGVRCLDLACSVLPRSAVTEADLVAFYVPMHTATRLAAKAIEKVRAIQPRAHICCYGLYAPMNELYLRERGVQTILGGEFEQGLADLARRLASGRNGVQQEPLISIARQRFLVPDRSGLPAFERYAKLLVNGEQRLVGYTESSRGCKHLCRHCPVVPVYNGTFRVVAREVVLEDIRRQVAAGAEHITFGDADFFNGPGHAMAIVEALRAENPTLTYDVTIKIEHLLRHRDLLPALKRTGCLFVTSAVEAIDDAVLEKLAKGHTRADFIETVRLMREAGLTLAPTFVTFTPWTTWEGYRELLQLLVALDLVENVSPIQLAMRLLIPAGSRLLELIDIRDMVGPFDPAALSYKWRHRDPGLDRLCAGIQSLIQHEERRKATRAEIFAKIWELAYGRPPDFHLASRASIPYLNEPWYC
ncbi:MAG TPA: CUAEP/CCAEP-tail radical SAM protein [Bryobacteraceae bacterium]|nr:CUAEP/CCAEP-tail radical SAM protein [Bryobacteraceae bacterium]